MHSNIFQENAKVIDTKELADKCGVLLNGKLNQF